MSNVLKLYIALVGLAGFIWSAYLVAEVDWQPSTLGEIAFFALLIVVAGSFPIQIASRVKTDVTTAALFSAVILLEPGAAALASTLGVSAFTIGLRYWREKVRLPWYQYIFNASATAFCAGVSAELFRAWSGGGEALSVAVVPAAATMYLCNTLLISGAVSLQMGMNPAQFWWNGTKENGLAELSLMAFGFLGAVLYQESAWTILALFLPVAIIYLAFSRLSSANTQLEEAMFRLEAIQGRIVSTSKLASVGAISLDLAHQVKNPLAILLGRLEGVQVRLPEGSRERQHIDIALNAGWRIQEITDTFIYIGQHNMVELDIVELLNDALVMAGLPHRGRIETQRHYPERPPRAMGNPVLLREAFTNIFSNSLEAIGEVGVVSISLSEVEGQIVVHISDNGQGISVEDMTHLFEPFQTTKEDGRGLGLFAAKHIFELHQGAIDIESQQGNGVKVTVTLPSAPVSLEAPVQRNDTLPSALLK